MTFRQSGDAAPKEAAGKETAQLSEEPGRHRPLQAGPLVEGRGDRARGERRVLARGAADQDRGVPSHSRRRRARGRAPERRDRPRGEHSAASPARSSTSIPSSSCRTAPSIRTIQLMFYTHQMDAQHKVTGTVQRAHRRQARPSGASRTRIDADEIIKTVLDGKGMRVATMLPSMHFGFDPKLTADQGRTRRAPRSSWPKPACAAASRSRCTARAAATCATRKWPRRCPASSRRPVSRPRSAPTTS